MLRPRVRLSIAIMAVPERANHVMRMKRALQDQISNALRAGLDVANGVGFSWDLDGSGPWSTWKRAFGVRDPETTHHAVLQDDLELCADLPATLVRLAEARPDDLISGWRSIQAVERAHTEGLRWVSCSRFLASLCVLMPVAMGEDMIRWHESRPAPFTVDHDDVRIAEYLRAHDRRAYVPVPNVVDHLGDELGGSTLGHAGGSKRRRRARVWLGEDGRGADLPWDDLRSVPA